MTRQIKPWTQCARFCAEVLESLHAARYLRMPPDQVHAWVCDIPFAELRFCDKLCHQFARDQQLPRLFLDTDLRASLPDATNDGIQQRQCQQLAFRLEMAVDAARYAWLRRGVDYTDRISDDLAATLITVWWTQGCRWANWKYGDSADVTDITDTPSQ